MSVIANGSQRLIAAPASTDWREARGDLTCLLAAAHEEQELGQYENAYTILRLAAAEALKRRWKAVPGKANSPIDDPTTLCQKLKQQGNLDNWLSHIIQSTGHRPCPVERQHVVVLSAAVQALVEGMA